MSCIFVSYVDVYDLDGPCFEIENFLESVAKRLKAYSKGITEIDTVRTSHFYSNSIVCRWIIKYSKKYQSFHSTIQKGKIGTHYIRLDICFVPESLPLILAILDPNCIALLGV